MTVTAGAYALAAATVVSAGAAVPVPPATAPAPRAKRPHPARRHAGRARGSAPPTTAYCEANSEIACYAANQVQQAYDLPALFAHGVNGPNRRS